MLGLEVQVKGRRLAGDAGHTNEDDEARSVDQGWLRSHLSCAPFPDGAGSRACS